MSSAMVTLFRALESVQLKTAVARKASPALRESERTEVSEGLLTLAPVSRERPRVGERNPRP